MFQPRGSVTMVSLHVTFFNGPCSVSVYFYKMTQHDMRSMCVEVSCTHILRCCQTAEHLKTLECIASRSARPDAGQRFSERAPDRQDRRDVTVSVTNLNLIIVAAA